MTTYTDRFTGKVYTFNKSKNTITNEQGQTDNNGKDWIEMMGDSLVKRSEVKQKRGRVRLHTGESNAKEGYKAFWLAGTNEDRLKIIIEGLINSGLIDGDSSVCWCDDDGEITADFHIQWNMEQELKDAYKELKKL